MPLQTASILVTGAASGVGAACARRLIDRGAVRLALLDRNSAALADLADALERPGVQIIRLTQDLADPVEWAASETRIRISFGGLTHVAARADIAATGEIATLRFDAWKRAVGANLDGAFLTLQAGLRLMRANGGRGGSIVLITPDGATRPTAGVAAQAASAAGALQLAKIAAIEGEADQIRVNVVRRHTASPDRTAAMVASLLANPAQMTGQALDADG